jgi:hypothetical protein
MNKKRHVDRLPWVSKGILEVNNSRYECFLDNISVKGALIDFCYKQGPKLNPGTVCTLEVVLLECY